MRFWRSSKDELIETQQALIKFQHQQIEELKALFNRSSQFEVVEQTEQGVTLKMKPITAGVGASQAQGRAGFRKRVAAGESQTKPAPSDSVSALEKRVAEAKGAQNAI